MTTRIVSKFELPTPSENFQFNLPPHKWSLPLDANNLDVLPGKTRTSFSNNNWGAGNKERRGKIWRYTDLSPFQPNYTPTGGGPSSRRNIKNRSKAQKEAERLEYEQRKLNTQLEKARKENLYGFQFLWNPTEYATSTAVSQNVVPAATDALSFLNMFQGTGTVNFSLQINRVNDFACFGSTVGTNFNRFYGSSYTSAGNRTELINDLKRRGTLADIEFLYKTINGGFIKNAANIDTSDIGIIVPTIVRIDIGPYAQIGIVNNISVAHKMFTQTMIPIVSEVSLGIQILSSYGFGLTPTQNQVVTGTPDGIFKKPVPPPMIPGR